MKKIIIIPWLLIILVSCKVNHSNAFDYNNGPNPWINTFKDQVFIGCLYQSYPSGARDSIFQIISKYDLYNPYDGFIDYKISNQGFLDSLAKSVPKNTPAFWHVDEPESKNKNVYLCNCLHFYNSSTLDAIAKKEYKKSRRSLKKAGLN